MVIDLHIHSNYSDGSLSPKEIVDESIRSGLSSIAITDHNTIKGSLEAISLNSKNIKILSGIELGIGQEDKFHILGYNIDLQSSSLIETLNKMKKRSIIETIELFRKLNSLGINIRPKDIINRDLELNRRNIISLMIEMKYVKSKQEAYERYFAYGKAAYIKPYILSPQEKIKVIKKAKGKAILAHPYQTESNVKELERIILELKQDGLDGLEVYHSGQNEKIERFLMNLAKKHSLIITGGSDFHGKLKPNVQLGRVFNNKKISYVNVEELERLP